MAKLHAGCVFIFYGIWHWHYDAKHGLPSVPNESCRWSFGEVVVVSWPQIREPRASVDFRSREITRLKLIATQYRCGSSRYFAVVKNTLAESCTAQVNFTAFYRDLQKRESCFRIQKVRSEHLDSAPYVADQRDAMDDYPFFIWQAVRRLIPLKDKPPVRISANSSAGSQSRNGSAGKVRRIAECVIVLDIVGQEIHGLARELDVRCFHYRLQNGDASSDVGFLGVLADEFCSALEQVGQRRLFRSRYLESQFVDLFALKIGCRQLCISLALRDQAAPNYCAEGHDSRTKYPKWCRNLDANKSGFVIRRNDDPVAGGAKSNQEDYRRGDSQALPSIFSLPTLLSARSRFPVRRHRTLHPVQPIPTKSANGQSRGEMIAVDPRL